MSESSKKQVLSESNELKTPQNLQPAPRPVQSTAASVPGLQAPRPVQPAKLVPPMPKSKQQPQQKIEESEKVVIGINLSRKVFKEDQIEDQKKKFDLIVKFVMEYLDTEAYSLISEEKEKYLRILRYCLSLNSSIISKKYFKDIIFDDAEIENNFAKLNENNILVQDLKCVINYVNNKLKAPKYKNNVPIINSFYNHFKILEEKINNANDIYNEGSKIIDDSKLSLTNTLKNMEHVINCILEKKDEDEDSDDENINIPAELKKFLNKHNLILKKDDIKKYKTRTELENHLKSVLIKTRSGQSYCDLESRLKDLEKKQIELRERATIIKKNALENFSKLCGTVKDLNIVNKINVQLTDFEMLSNILNNYGNCHDYLSGIENQIRCISPDDREMINSKMSLRPDLEKTNYLNIFGIAEPILGEKRAHLFTKNVLLNDCVNMDGTVIFNRTSFFSGLGDLKPEEMYKLNKKFSRYNFNIALKNFENGTFEKAEAMFEMKVNRLVECTKNCEKCEIDITDILKDGYSALKITRRLKPLLSKTDNGLKLLSAIRVGNTRIYRNKNTGRFTIENNNKLDKRSILEGQKRRNHYEKPAQDFTSRFTQRKTDDNEIGIVF